jgi:glycerophosphoryl diester phosphodiesterase
MTSRGLPARTGRTFNRAPEGFVGCFGHRGAAGIFPENTLEGFVLAARLGVDVIETDAHVTRDGRVVLCHDPTVDRTTDGEGAIASMTYAELRSLDAGARFLDRDGRQVFRGCGLRIPLLEEVLVALSSSRFNIELKSRVDGAVPLLREAIERGGGVGRVLLAAEDADVMNEIRRLISWAPTSCSAAEVFDFLNSWHEAHYEPPPACALQVPDVFAGIEVVTDAFVRRAKALNMLVHVWTINDPSAMRRLRAMGCDGIITDHPERWMLSSPAPHSP